eukprot:4586002-Pleurochrysis_carterae.AAC.1
MVAAAEDGSYLFDPALNVFESIAEEQPLFKRYLETKMRAEKFDTSPFFARRCARPMARKALQIRDGACCGADAQQRKQSRGY